MLAVALLAESVSFTRVLRELRRGADRAKLGLGRYLDVSTDPTTKTVLFEDVAGVVGVLVAAAGIAAHQVTGQRAYEGVASIVIGIGLAVVAFELGAVSKDLLIGQSARPEELARIRDAIADYPEVAEIVDVRTVHTGPHDLFVAIRVDFRDGVTSEVIEEVSARIEHDLRAVVPDVADVFLDRRGSDPAVAGVGERVERERDQTEGDDARQQRSCELLLSLARAPSTPTAFAGL